MQSMSDILKIKDPEERRKAIEARKRAREEEERNDPLREVKQALKTRIMGCPQFLSFAIAPIPNFLQGKVPVDVISQRTLNALRIIDFAKPEIKEILAESYAQEVELIRALIHALGARDVAFGLNDLHDAAQMEAFQQEVKAAFEAYMAQPEMERKHFIL